MDSDGIYGMLVARQVGARLSIYGTQADKRAAETGNETEKTGFDDIETTKRTDEQLVWKSRMGRRQELRYQAAVTRAVTRLNTASQPVTGAKLRQRKIHNRRCY